MAQRQPASVEALFSAETGPIVRRVQLNDRWIPVGQGRNWADADGWHVLIMLPDTSVRQLTLNRETLAWEITSDTTGTV